MSVNPIKSPIKTGYAKIGAHAIAMGEVKLGSALEKCMREIALIYDLPNSGQKDMMMRKLYANLRSIMGLPTEE